MGAESSESWKEESDQDDMSQRWQNYNKGHELDR